MPKFFELFGSGQSQVDHIAKSFAASLVVFFIVLNDGVIGNLRAANTVCDFFLTGKMGTFRIFELENFVG